jgi:hypothetical protein
MICEHGVDIRLHPSWEVCIECNHKRQDEQQARLDLLKRAFSGWIETGFWGDIDNGVGKLYYSIYRKNF